MNISLAAEPVFHIGSFPVTNTLLTAWIAMAVLILLALFLRRSLTDVPKGLQNVAEAILEAILNLMDSVTGSREKSRRYLPLVATIFLFILTANWLGLMPGFGSVGMNESVEGVSTFVPYLRSTNSDLNVTIALAVISVLAIQFFGIAAVGVVRYSKRFLNFSNPIMTFVGVIELISEVAKLVSFSFRLFGNVFAGEVLLTVVAGLIPVAAPVPFYFLEVFVGFIQAFVFAILTLVFIQVATVETHEGKEEVRKE